MKRLIINSKILGADKRSRRAKGRESAQDMMRKIVRCRSSNVWGYFFDIRDNDTDEGTLYVQFKNSNGGAGDLYRYYNFPARLYRKLISTPSKGHFFWRYIRNNFNYSKLSGDKRGKLSNAIN